MSEFQPGDQVKCYGIVQPEGHNIPLGTPQYVIYGEIMSISKALGVWVMSKEGGFRFWAHPKQLRKIKHPSPRRRFWAHPKQLRKIKHPSPRRRFWVNAIKDRAEETLHIFYNEATALEHRKNFIL